MTRIKTLLLATTTAALFAGPAAAAERVPVGHFDHVLLNGGGHVTIKYGATQSVTILKGSTQFTSFTIRHGNELQINACNDSCPHSYDLDVEIVTPALAAAAINGGGEIDAMGKFPGWNQFTAAVNGGGEMDLSAISAAQATAAVNGGGHILVTATASLTAAVHGGGEISYRGNPQVTQAIQGGGSVDRAN